MEKTNLTMLDQLKNSWIRAAVTPFLIVIFILLFQPFDYNLLSSSIKFQILSIVAVGSFIFSIVCRFVTKGRGIPTTIKIVIYLLFIITFSQLLYLFTIATGLNNFSWEGCVAYIFSTLMIAFLPITFDYIVGLISIKDSKTFEVKKQTITLGEHTLYLSAIVLIKAEDNYIRIHQVDHAPLLVRSTLREAVRKTADTTFFKVHRSFIVNLNAIKSISGNANGYKLHLNQYDALVPVARNKGNLLKKKIKTIRA